MPVSESLHFMSKSVVRRFKHPMAIGLPFTCSIHYLAWWIAPVPVSMFKPKGISTLDIKGGSMSFLYYMLDYKAIIYVSFKFHVPQIIFCHVTTVLIS